MIIVSIAGVLTSLILAVISIFLLYFIRYIIFRDFAWLTSEAGSMAATVVFQVLMYLVIININLAVFNLVPIPPLDGYKLFKEIFIGKINYNFFAGIERYSNIVLFIFLIFSDRIGLISMVSGFIYDLMVEAMNLIFIAFI